MAASMTTMCPMVQTLVIFQEPRFLIPWHLRRKTTGSTEMQQVNKQCNYRVILRLTFLLGWQ